MAALRRATSWPECHSPAFDTLRRSNSAPCNSYYELDGYGIGISSSFCDELNRRLRSSRAGFWSPFLQAAFNSVPTPHPTPPRTLPEVADTGRRKTLWERISSSTRKIRGLMRQKKDKEAGGGPSTQKKKKKSRMGKLADKMRAAAKRTIIGKGKEKTEEESEETEELSTQADWWETEEEESEELSTEEDSPETEELLTPEEESSSGSSSESSLY